MSGGKGRQRAERVDKKHRFPLRMETDLHYEADALSFQYRLSLNFLYTEAIDWALHHPEFLRLLEREFRERVNPKRGHFVWHKDWRAER